MFKNQYSKYLIAAFALLVAGVVALFFGPMKLPACACAAVLLSATMMHGSIRNILVISYRKRIFDIPDSRRVHKTPTPRVGGFTFTPIILCSTIFIYALYDRVSPSDIPVYGYVLLIVPLILLWLVGVADDLVSVRYHIKFLAQIVAGLLVVCSGFWIDNLHGFAGMGVLPAAAGMPLTVLFIVFTINALNLIDGIDGLASGICIIATGIYSVWFLAAGEYLLSFVALTSLGVLLPFFYANVRGMGLRKHKLFMGDTGSLTMGLVVSTLAIANIMSADAAGLYHPKHNFISDLSPLLVPIFDAAHVVVFRMIKGVPIFRPDKTHIHHRLLNKGFTHAQTLTIILCLAALITLLSILLSPYMNPTLIFAMDALIWISFNWKIAQSSKRIQTQTTKSVQL